jgi:hypothetical protein
MPGATGQIHHCFRKGFVSELKRSRAVSDAVEFLVGHSLGLRGVYSDACSLPLQEAVGLVPRLGLARPVIHLVGKQARGPISPRRVKCHSGFQTQT